MYLRRLTVPFALVALAVSPREALAQNGPGGLPMPQERPPAVSSSASETEIAKTAQNPIANILNIPVEQNFNFKSGLSNRTQYNLNLRPSIPIPISDRFLIVTRVVLPILDQPVREEDRVFGLGDTTANFFLATRFTRELSVGLGPAVSIPTATNAQLGSEKWALGPSAVASYESGPWVVGTLAQNLWSFAGDKDRASTNGLLVQPFVNYNWRGGWAVTSSPYITMNWKAEGSDVFTVPIGGGVSKVMKMDDRMALNLALHAYANVTRPIDGPDGTVRATLALLMPK